MTGPAGGAKQILICVNARHGPGQASCAGRGSTELVAALRRAAQRRGEQVCVDTITCFGHCERGPTVRFAPGGAFYHRVREEDIERLLADFARWEPVQLPRGGN